MENVCNVLLFSENGHTNEEMKKKLNKLYPSSNFLVVDNINALIDILSTTNQFHVLFADIDLHTRDSFHLISNLKSFLGELIFQSTSTEFAISAYDLSAADYLLKPYSSERLQDAFSRAFSRLKEKKKKNEATLIHKKSRKIKNLSSILVKDQETQAQIVLKTSDIIFFYAVKGLIHIKTKNKTYFQYNTLSALEKMLDHSSFLRTNRSYICNLNHVKSIITLKNNRYALLLNMESSENLSIPIKRGIKLKIIDRIRQIQGYADIQ